MRPVKRQAGESKTATRDHRSESGGIKQPDAEPREPDPILQYGCSRLQKLLDSPREGYSRLSFYLQSIPDLFPFWDHGYYRLLRLECYSILPALALSKVVYHAEIARSDTHLFCVCAGVRAVRACGRAGVRACARAGMRHNREKNLTIRHSRIY